MKESFQPRGHVRGRVLLVVAIMSLLSCGGRSALPLSEGWSGQLADGASRSCPSRLRDAGPTPGPATWKKERYSASTALRSVWGSPDGCETFIVGEKGTILRWRGDDWEAMKSPTQQDIYGVWGESSTRAYAVAENHVLRFDGSEWTIDETFASGAYRAIWGAEGHVFVGGWSRVLHRDPGGGLEEYMNVHFNEVWSVAGTSPKDVVAIGDIAVRYDGTGWTKIQAYGADPPNGCVAAGIGGSIWVGCGYLLMELRDGVWTQKIEDKRIEPLKIWGLRGNDMWIGGLGLQHWVEGQLVAEEGPHGLYLGIWGRGPEEIYAASELGGIFRYAP